MTTYADRIISELSVVTDGNPDFQVYISSLAQMFEEITSYARDTDNGQVGWSVALDLNRIPTTGLPWLAQFVGAQTIQGLSDADQRTWIRAATNQKRGTVQSMMTAAQLHLTGTKFVILRERSGSPWQLIVVTKTSETPTPSLTLADMMAVKPAGIILTHSVLSGNDYQLVFQNNATYAILFAKYTTYQGMLNDVPGT
jgi:hypothetical protein